MNQDNPTHDALVFDAIGKSREVILKAADGDICLLLIEMDGDDHERFMALHHKRLSISDSGEAMMKDFDGMRIELLSRACRIMSIAGVQVDQKSSIPTTAFFKKHGIKSSIIQRLYDEALKLNRAKGNSASVVDTLVAALKSLAEDGEMTDEIRQRVQSALETAPLGERLSPSA